jgi:hypothetical protein
VQGATAGAVYGDSRSNPRARIPESVRREVCKCRNEPNSYDSRLSSHNCKNVSLLLVGFRGESKLWIDMKLSHTVGTVKRRHGGQEQSGSRVCLNTRGGRHQYPWLLRHTSRLRLGKPNLGLSRGILHKRLNINSHKSDCLLRKYYLSDFCGKSDFLLMVTGARLRT